MQRQKNAHATIRKNSTRTIFKTLVFFMRFFFLNEATEKIRNGRYTRSVNENLILPSKKDSHRYNVKKIATKMQMRKSAVLLCPPPLYKLYIQFFILIFNIQKIKFHSFHYNKTSLWYRAFRNYFANQFHRFRWIIRVRIERSGFLYIWPGTPFYYKFPNYKLLGNTVSWKEADIYSG